MKKEKNKKKKKSRYAARQILLVAKPGHGKTTKILELLPTIIKDRIHLEQSGIWPHLYFDEVVNPRIDIYDPKREVEKIAREYSDRVFRHATGSGAAWASYQAMLDGEVGNICILEEMLTLASLEYKWIQHVSVMRRKDTGGDGLLIFATSQRIYTTPMSLRAASDELWLGKITSPRDIAGAIDVTGDDSLGIVLPNLPIGKWVKKEL